MLENAFGQDDDRIDRRSLYEAFQLVSSRCGGNGGMYYQQDAIEMPCTSLSASNKVCLSVKAEDSGVI